MREALWGGLPCWEFSWLKWVASPGVTPLPGAACIQYRLMQRYEGRAPLPQLRTILKGQLSSRFPYLPPCSWLRLLWLHHSPEPPSAQSWALPAPLFIQILRTHPHKAPAHPSPSIGLLMNPTHASPLLGSAFKPWSGPAPSVWSRLLPSQNHLSSAWDVIFSCSWVLTAPLHLPPLALLMRSSPSFEAHFRWCLF